MLKLALVGSRVYCDDRYLCGENSSDPDRRLACMRDFKRKLKDKGVELVHWQDVAPDDTWGYIFFNYKEREFRKIARIRRKGHLFLLVCENEVVCPDNWNLNIHAEFDAVFTWDMRPLPKSGDVRYFRYFLPNDLSDYVDPPSFADREKLAVMVAANKWKRRPGELYTERFKAIRWFMKNHPDDLDLYGYDWKYRPAKKALEMIRNAFRSVGGYPTRPVDVSPVYRGPVSTKRDILKRYKFCLCYENARDIPGYVTEKIFDCFLGGVVPIYMGWEGVSDFIPRDSFLDFRSFRDYDDMYDKISGLSEGEWSGYLHGARAFLESDSAKPFHYTSFSDSLVDGLAHWIVAK